MFFDAEQTDNTLREIENDLYRMQRVSDANIAVRMLIVGIIGFILAGRAPGVGPDSSGQAARAARAVPAQRARAGSAPARHRRRPPRPVPGGDPHPAGHEGRQNMDLCVP